MASKHFISILFVLTIISLTVLQVSAENFGPVSCVKGVGWVPSVAVVKKFTSFCPISLPVSESTLACTLKCALKKLNALDANEKLVLDKALPDILLSFPKNKHDSIKAVIKKCNNEHGKNIKAEKDEPQGDKCASYKNVGKCLKAFYKTSCK